MPGTALLRATAATPFAAAPVKRPRLPSRCASRNVSRTFKLYRHTARSATDNEVDLEAEVEAFLKKQAEIESGAAFARTASLEKVVGGELVSEEQAKMYCREIVDLLKSLKRNRDMGIAEVKLVVSIEDPRARERRAMGIENDNGVSRDEMGVALLEVAEGRLPRDRLALKCLYDEMSTWPTDAPENKVPETPASKASTYSALEGGTSVARPYVMGKAARQNDKPQELTDMLPDWVGFTTLYGISVIPIILAGGAVLILFANALK